MARFMSFVKTIKNNWKKSIVGAAAFSYSISYSLDAYETEQLMREYCEEATVYGDKPLPTFLKPQHITVILNPVAKKRKARKLFEKYCEPLLHLAGYSVSIIQTQSENQARNLISNLNFHTDIIVVAGGDGTLSDVITGIMRRYKNDNVKIEQCYIGILPLGQMNKIANSLFFGYNDLIEVRKLIDATMAIIKGKTKLADVIKVELLEKDIEHPSEPVYAVGTVEWGVWNDAYYNMDKYWYWGFLRRYVTYIFNGLKGDRNWKCDGIIRYSDPCNGCSKCYKEYEEKTASERRWWHAFLPRRNNSQPGKNYIDYSKITNESCGFTHEIPISTTELHIRTQNIVQSISDSAPSVKVELGPEMVSYTDFITEGWRRLSGNKTLINKTIEVKNIEIYPKKINKFVDKTRSFYIDNEEFELKSVKFKLLPRAIRIFCPSIQERKT